MHDILILGGGFGGVYSFLQLHKKIHRRPDVRIRILNRENYFLFTPLLHEVATGSVDQDNIIYNLREIFTCCLADFATTTVERVDLVKKEVHTTKDVYAYDTLIYALGADTNYYNLPIHDNPHVFPLKTLDEAKALKNKIIDVFENSLEPSFVVAGGGPTGVEIVAELKEFIDDLLPLFPSTPREKVRIRVIQGGNKLLPTFNPKLGNGALKVLRERGITISLNTMITAINGATLHLNDGTTMSAEVIVWAAGVRPNIVDFSPDIPRDEKGRIAVTPFLNLETHPEVFVVGDSAGIPGVPMTAQSAVKSAQAAADNIAYCLANKPMRPFVYQHKGDLFSLGQWMAGAEISNKHFFGHIAWWMWRTIYLSKLIGLRNKIKVAVDWTLDLFEPRDLNRY